MATPSRETRRASRGRRAGARHAARLMGQRALQMEYALAEARRRELIEEREAASKWDWLKRGLAGALSGAATGMMSGNPYGAIIGAGIGFGAGAISSALDPTGEDEAYRMMSQGSQSLGQAYMMKNYRQRGAEKGAPGGFDTAGMDKMLEADLTRPAFLGPQPTAGLAPIAKPQPQFSTGMQYSVAGEPVSPGTPGGGAVGQQPVTGMMPSSQIQSPAAAAPPPGTATQLTPEDLRMLFRERRGLGLPQYQYPEEIYQRMA